MESLIEKIRSRLKSGSYQNETAVRQGIVIPVLRELHWDVDDVEIVYPEYPVPGGRVDLALCYPPSRARVLIEIKQIGLSDGAEPQLFQYAYHDGNQMVVLTDGRIWSLYLPGEQGSYEERRVYKLDIAERDLSEIVGRLQRYLAYSRVKSGEAYQAARLDYQDIARGREVKRYLPQAWDRLIQDKDEYLIELVASKVESLCGFRPDENGVFEFLAQLSLVQQPFTPVTRAAPILRKSTIAKSYLQKSPMSEPVHSESLGYELHGRFFAARNNRDVLVRVMQSFASSDITFLERFARHRSNEKRERKLLGRSVEEIFANPNERISGNYTQLPQGWFLMTKLSVNSISRVLQLACEVAGVQYNVDFKPFLRGNPRKK